MMTRIVFRAPRRNSRGMSLIELMIALVISSIVVLGLVTLVNAIGVANRTQDGLARLQENGRFAMQRIATDLRAATSQHCSAFNINAPPVGEVLFVDQPRVLTSHFNAAAAPVGIGGTAASPDYPISTRFLLQGHECNAATCVPALNVADRGVNRLGAAIPNMGTAVGLRGQGADVLTLRFLEGAGMPVVAQVSAPGGDSIVLANDPAALARSGFSTMAANDAVWLSNCARTAIFRGTPTSVTEIAMAVTNFAATGLDAQAPDPDPNFTRVTAFHVPTAMRTVSYHLQIAADPQVAGRSISVLMRKEDADLAQVLVQGVERLDFLYGVQTGNGRTLYLTAAQVDAFTQCAGVPEPGCGWRAVKSVEVYMLASTVDDVSSQRDDEFRYSWLNDGSPNVAGVFENPQTLGVLRNGLPAGRTLRREFRTLVNLRSFNY